MNLTKEFLKEYLKDNGGLVFPDARLGTVNTNSGYVEFREYSSDRHDYVEHSIELIDLVAWAYFNGKEKQS